MAKHCADNCPHPTSEAPDQIGFTPQPQVDWLGVVQLLRTGLKAGAAGTFGSWADKRELQAALAQITDVDGDYSDREELWFDYMADTGDGFDTTYSMARLLAEPRLRVNDAEELPRGELLLLGGDQVYPVASRDNYRDRFLGPFRAALPYVEPQPALYALPGNHDWYDGLTSFMRLFAQRRSGEGGRPIGGWMTRQRRSYFALALPYNWWIWAVDTQLESDLDQPQLHYFEALRAEMLERDPNPAHHKIVLVTAEPTWIDCPDVQAPRTCRRFVEGFNTLAHFEKRFIREQNFQLKLVLAGDLHHYARYQTAGGDGTVRVTSGGGGAYLVATHTLPPKLTLREEPVSPAATYALAKTYPLEEDSKRLRNGVAALPFRNRSFGALVGIVWALIGWTWHAAYMHHAGFWGTLLSAPLSALLAVLVIAGAWQVTLGQSKGYKGLATHLGALHGLAQVALCYWFAHSLEQAQVARPYAILLLFAAGWLAGGWLYALYLRLMSGVTGIHTGELFSSIGITGYKHFLRFHLTKEGLRVYAVGLREIARDWTFEAPGEEEHGQPWFESKTFGNVKAQKPEIVDRFEVK